jgi:hypothetical protein
MNMVAHKNLGAIYLILGQYDSAWGEYIILQNRSSDLGRRLFRLLNFITDSTEYRNQTYIN